MSSVAFSPEFRIRVPDLDPSLERWSVRPTLRFHPVVGASFAFSTFIAKKICCRIGGSVLNLRPRDRHTSGGWPMTTEDMVVDVSQDWLQACSVQEHFMRGPALNNCWVNLSASCRQMRALGGDYYNFAFLGDGQIAMLVGDASGKGVAAALMMASVQASVRTAA